jgi:hypothetical protein
VLVKEVEGPVEHPINLGTQALTLAELKVSSKPLKPKTKPGRKKKAAAVAIEDLDEEEDGQQADAADAAGCPSDFLSDNCSGTCLGRSDWSLLFMGKACRDKYGN